MKRLIRKAAYYDKYFPTFKDDLVDFQIPAGFTFNEFDCRNDHCPAFENEALGLKLWVDRKDSGKRQQSNQFELYKFDYGMDGEVGDEVLGTDSYQELVSFINSYKPEKEAE